MIIYVNIEEVADTVVYDRMRLIDVNRPKINDKLEYMHPFKI